MSIGPLQSSVTLYPFVLRTEFLYWGNPLFGLLLQNAKGVFFMNKTHKIAFTAMLSALSVLANCISVTLSGSNYLSFTFIPTFIAGIYFGVLPAAIVGFVGDLIGGILFPKGAYNVLIALASTLMGIIPALVYKLPKLSKMLKLVISLVICTIVCSAGLNTYALWVLYGAKNGKTFWVYLWGRLPFQLINTVVNGILLAVIQQTKVIDKLLLRITQK